MIRGCCACFTCVNQAQKIYTYLIFVFLFDNLTFDKMRDVSQLECDLEDGELVMNAVNGF